MTETTTRHPLHALYLGRSHGEAGTIGLRARLARKEAAAGDGAATSDRAAALPTGLGLAAATVAAARVVGKMTGSR